MWKKVSKIDNGSCKPELCCDVKMKEIILLLKKWIDRFHFAVGLHSDNAQFQ